MSTAANPSARTLLITGALVALGFVFAEPLVTLYAESFAAVGAPPAAA